MNDIVWIKAKRKGGAFDLKAPPRGVDDGILPAPLAPACAGYPQGGVPVARGLVARLLAPSPLHPPGVVDSNPDTPINQKPRTLSGTGLLVQGAFKGVELTGTLPSFFAGLKTET